MACAGQFEQWRECWPLDSECEQWLVEHELEYRLWIFLKLFEFQRYISLCRNGATGKQVQRRMEIARDLAYRCISYFGWFKNSDSDHFKKKYGIEQLMKYAKSRVSIENRRKSEASQIMA